MILGSYKEHFNNSVGAFSYIYFCKYFPELSLISTNDEKSFAIDEIKEFLYSANNLNEIISFFEKMPESKLAINREDGIIEKSDIINKFKQLTYLDEDFSWDLVQTQIEFNELGKFNHDLNEKLKLKKLAKEFGLKEININSLENISVFYETMHSDLTNLTNLLGLNKEAFGMNVLCINYQAEHGDYTGYFDLKNNIIINKKEVLAHEWLHFIDYSLGFKNYSLTDLMEIKDVKEFFKINGLIETLSFKDTLYQQEKEYKTDFVRAIKSLGHFFYNFSHDKNSFYSNLEKIALKFIENKDEEKYIKDIDGLLESNRPNRYFSFFKAQSALYLKNNEKLQHNQLIDFSKNADKHLGESNYTESLIECYARTFESFLFDKFKDHNLKSSVLADNYDSDFYPQDSFRKIMNTFWEKSFPDIIKNLNEIIEKKESLKIKTNIESLREKFNIGTKQSIKKNKIN